MPRVYPIKPAFQRALTDAHEKAQLQQKHFEELFEAIREVAGAPAGSVIEDPAVGFVVNDVQPEDTP